MGNIKCKNHNMTGYLVVSLLVLVFLFPISNFLFALGVCKWDSNGVVVSNAPRIQGNDLCIAGDGNNGAVIVWSDDRNSSVSEFDIYAQRLDSLGNCLWTANGVPIVTVALWQHRPCIVSDGSGGAIIAWQDERNGMDIYAQRIDSLGNCLWAVNGVPICADSGAEVYPCITTDGYGGAIIAWQSDPGWPIPVGSQFGIYAQRVDSAGNVRWVVDGIAVAPDHDSLYQTEQQIISDGNSGAIICWQQAEDTTSSPDYDVYAQRVDSLGNLMWGNNGVAVCTTQYSSTYPMVTSDSVGGLIIIWSDNRNGNWDVYAQRVNSNGNNKWVPNGIPVCTHDSLQAYRMIVSDLQCGGIIIWGDGRNGNWDIYAQRIDSSGNYLWTPNGIPVCVKPGSQTWLGVCSDLAGGATITWQDNRNANYDIYCQRVDDSGNCLWEQNGLGVCTQDSVQEKPVIVNDGTLSGAIIAWQDSRNRFTTRHDVYAQRVGDTLIVGTKEMTDDRYQMTDIKLEIHPNPFSEKTDIRYMIHDTGFMIKNISLKIYDVSGRVVKILANESTGSGIYRVFWDGTDSNNKPLPKGVYFCILETEKDNFVKKILSMK